MEFIKQNFSIKDLENLSGIKSHSIRIWEKPYNILSPKRTATNIRAYSYSHLQKLLNIPPLNEHAYRVFRISRMSHKEVKKMVKHINASTSKQNRPMKSLLESHKKVSFLSYFTNTPVNLKDFLNQLCEEKNHQLQLFRNKAHPEKETDLPTHINIYDLPTDFLKTI